MPLIKGQHQPTIDFQLTRFQIVTAPFLTEMSRVETSRYIDVLSIATAVSMRIFSSTLVYALTILYKPQLS